MNKKLFAIASLMLGLFGAAVSQPAVFYASDPVFPNETVLATTGNTDKYSSVNIAQLPNTAAGSPLNRPPALPSLNPASVIQASGTSVKFVVPPTFQKGAYVFQVSTSSGVSTPQYLNVPHVMFIQGDMGDAGSNGGWLEVHGRTVGLPGGTPRMALVQNNTIVAFLKPDPNDAANTIYRQRFLIPTTTPPGVYACYVHNGYGGPNGWTKYDTFVNAPVNTVRIVPRRSWPTATVHLAAPTGGYDDNLFASAFAQLPNGGILNMAAGTYKLSKQLVLPNHLSLRGTSAQTTTLNWVTDPLSGSSYLPLITAKTIGTQPVTFAPIRGTFELSRFNVVATSNYNGTAIDREFCNEFGRVSYVNVTLPKIGNYQTNAKALYMRQTSNLEVTNCTFDARTCINTAELVSNIRIEYNVLKWREVSFNITGADNNFIFTHNTVEMKGNAASNGWFANDNPGFWYTTFGGIPNSSGPYTENLYYAKNTSIHDVGFTSAENGVGLTFDGGDGIYYGNVSSLYTSSGVNYVKLTHGTDVLGSNYNYAGGVMKIESGKGMGQWAYITSATPGATTVSIDHPFAIPPDGSSIISIVNMQGEAIFEGNDFGAEPTNQAYYFSMDVIKANNTYRVGGDKVWAGVHYGMPFSDWHFQFLNNTLTVPQTEYMAFTTGGMSGYTGPVAADFVYRNNVDSSSGSSMIEVRSSSGLFRDGVLEGNDVSYVGLGRSNDPLNFDGIVLRHNPGASYNFGNLYGRNPGAVAGICYQP